MVYCDESRCEMALTNLLGNALKYTPAGGHVEIGVEQTKSSVHIWVQDTGPGIQAQDLPHIFERFYRGHNNTAHGSGLGLSIVQSVIQAHGWRITVENVPDGGARFTILCLPSPKQHLKPGLVPPSL
jgi:signal transduction histidine kinase